MIESKATDYDTAIVSIARIFPQLALQPLKVKQTAEEIRIKAGAPIIIRSGTENSVLQTNVSQSQIEEAVIGQVYAVQPYTAAAVSVILRI